MNNTIFDDVFRTMIEKMPYLAVPLINEVFHTSYPGRRCIILNARVQMILQWRYA